MTIENIKRRKEVINCIRNFFDSKEYLEVETPLLSPALIPESAIEIFKTEQVHPFKDKRELYLIPSPEVYLKRFLSKNPVNIYEISRCFRNSEQSSSQHNSEFTMLEYYTMGFNETDTLNLTIKLFKYINSKLPYSKLPDNFEIATMDEAFIRYTGFSLKENSSITSLHKICNELGLNWDSDDSWETAFNRVFLNHVEPNFPKDVNLFLTNYPSKIETLAEKIPGTPWARRWELYINGIECGNCYSEERNPVTVMDFFKTESDIKTELALVKHSVDSGYYKIFKDFPKCSGGAIGVDRLIMAILGEERIEGVILFPNNDNI